MPWRRAACPFSPLQPDSKLPDGAMCPDWTRAASTDLDQVRRWWLSPNGTERDNNVGILTTDFVAVDVDVKDEKPGLVTMFNLGFSFDTFTTRTPTGGYHLVYSNDGEPVGQAPLGEGVDVRALNGYIVAPGSTIGGVPYVIEIDQPILPFPQHLRSLLSAPRRRHEEVACSVELDMSGSIETARHWLERDAPPAIEGQNGDDTTYRVACRVRDYGVSEPVATELMFEVWNERCEPPWDVADLEIRVRNAYKYATGEAGAASPQATFGGIKPIEASPTAPDLAAFVEKQPSRSSFKPVDEFCAAYEPLSYVVEPIVRTGSIYTLTARTGAGKTALAVIVCHAITTGRADILDLEVVRGRVAYCAFENPDDVRMRIMVSASRLGIDLAAIAQSFLVLDARLSPEDLVAELRDQGATANFSLVIIDTFAAAFDGRDVNDNVQAGEFIRRLRPITQLPGLPALLIPAHPTKNATADQLVPYGGGAILNEVDGNLSLASGPSSGQTRLHWQGKYRGLEFTPRHFRFEIFESPLVVDKKGRCVRLPVLRPCTPDDADRAAEGNVERSIQVLRAMEANPKATIRELGLATGISKSSAGRTLVELVKLKLIEQKLGRWSLTRRGRDELKEISA